MSDPKFTPGPWVTHQVADEAWGIRTEDGGDVALIFPADLGVYRSRVKAAATAKLIAAAPELYASLAKLVWMKGRTCQEIDKRAICKHPICELLPIARAALAKAEGRDP